MKKNKMLKKLSFIVHNFHLHISTLKDGTYIFEMYDLDTNYLRFAKCGFDFCHLIAETYVAARNWKGL